MVIGVTGGVGSGKSIVLALLKEKYNAYLLKLDDYGNEAYERDNPCYFQIIKAFGEEILDKEGNINKKRLADIVFGKPEQLEILNGIIHPYVWNRQETERKNIPGDSLAVIESAILFEAGYGSICDEVWGVFSNEDIRRKRLRESRGYTDEKTNAVMEAQMPQEKLMEYCDRIIYNNGKLTELESQLQKLLGTD